MIRSAVLSIVLLLAVGPSAAQLCTVWCQPAETTSSACDHQNNSTASRLTTHDACAPTAAVIATSVRGEAKRASLTGTIQLSVAVPRFLATSPDPHSVEPVDPPIAFAGYLHPHLVSLRV